MKANYLSISVMMTKGLEVSLYCIIKVITKT